MAGLFSLPEVTVVREAEQPLDIIDDRQEISVRESHKKIQNKTNLSAPSVGVGPFFRPPCPAPPPPPQPSRAGCWWMRMEWLGALRGQVDSLLHLRV